MKRFLLITTIVGVIVLALTANRPKQRGKESTPIASVAPQLIKGAEQDQTATIKALREENAMLRAELTQLKAKKAQEIAEPNSPATMSVGARQRAIIDNLRQIAIARDAYHRAHGKPPTSLSDIVGQRKLIRQLNSIAGESYLQLPMTPGALLAVTTDEGMAVIYDPSGLGAMEFAPLSTEEQAEEVEKKHALESLNRLIEESRRIQPSVRIAMAAYRAAHKDSDPPSATALLPYFSTTKEAVDYLEVMELQKGAKAAQRLLNK